MTSHINQEMMISSQILTDQIGLHPVIIGMLAVVVLLSDHEMIDLDLVEAMTDRVLIVPPDQVIVQRIHCRNNYEEKMKKKLAVPANLDLRRDLVGKFIVNS
jgi:hypothetical protein